MKKFVVPAYSERELERRKEISSRLGESTEFDLGQYEKENIKCRKKIVLELKSYMNRNAHVMTPDVTNFLQVIIDNIFTFENRLQICHDGSYRNFVLLVRPDKIYVTGNYRLALDYDIPYDYNKLETPLDYVKEFLKCGETLFLNMTNETELELKENRNHFEYDFDFYH